ncbi:MAG: pentapeptide repeat-containing protein [Anaerolineae bacterium]|nr:pentapeptide repeat-containing protein [Anaerolineae bacterium]
MIKSFRRRVDFIGPFDVVITAVLLGLFVGAVFGSRAAHAASLGVDWFAWWDGFLQNFGTEMLGAFLTFFLLELLRGSREKQAEEARRDEERRQLEEAEERRAEMTRKQVVSLIQAQEIARLRAAQTPEDRQPILDSMNATGLLEEASLGKADLKGARLMRANLAGAALVESNLQGAYLWLANLEGADLWGADLERARLTEANIREANLDKATLKGADLFRASLVRATLRSADLAGADLWEANLRWAVLTDANLDGAHFEGATLPDGTKLPGRSYEDREEERPEPDWRTPFEAWDRAGRSTM